VAHDVLHLDDGVVHQNAHHQRQSQQRDHVDRKPQQVHADEGRNDRQRKRHGRDKGGAPVAQEQPHHQHGQQRAFVQQVHGAVVFLLHRGHEVECLGDFQARMLCAQLLQCRLYGGAHFHLAGALAARHLEAHHRLAVEQRQGARFGNGVGDGGHLVQAQAAPVGQGQRQVGQLLRRLHRGQGTHGLFAAAQVGASPGAFLLHQAQLARNVGRCGRQGLQAQRVQGHMHLPVDATHAVDGAHAAHGEQLLRDVVVDEPGQGLVVHARRGDGEGQHRLRGQIHLGHDGVAHVARQVAAHAGHGRAHIVQRFLRGFLQPELGRDGGAPVLHLGVDVLETLQRGNAVLDLARHIVLQLRRRCAGQRHGHGDGGQIDVREVLHLHSIEGQQAAKGQQHKQHQCRNGVFDRPGGHIHAECSLNNSYQRLTGKR